MVRMIMMLMLMIMTIMTMFSSLNYFQLRTIIVDNEFIVDDFPGLNEDILLSMTLKATYTYSNI